MSDFSLRNARRRDFLKGVGAAGGAMALSVTLPRALWAQSPPPKVPIGQVVAFTGSGAEYGPFFRDAAQLALNQINTAAEQVFGGPIVERLIAEELQYASNTCHRGSSQAGRGRWCCRPSSASGRAA